MLFIAIIVKKVSLYEEEIKFDLFGSSEFLFLLFFYSYIILRPF